MSRRKAVKANRYEVYVSGAQVAACADGELDIVDTWKVAAMISCVDHMLQRLELVVDPFSHMKVKKIVPAIMDVFCPSLLEQKEFLKVVGDESKEVPTN